MSDLQMAKNAFVIDHPQIQHLIVTWSIRRCSIVWLPSAYNFNFGEIKRWRRSSPLISHFSFHHHRLAWPSFSSLLFNSTLSTHCSFLQSFSNLLKASKNATKETTPKRPKRQRQTTREPPRYSNPSFHSISRPFPFLSQLYSI